MADLIRVLGKRDLSAPEPARHMMEEWLVTTLHQFGQRGLRCRLPGEYGMILWKGVLNNRLPHMKMLHATRFIQIHTPFHGVGYRLGYAIQILLIIKIVVVVMGLLQGPKSV